MDNLSEQVLRQWQSDQGFQKIYNHYAPYVWRIAFRMVNGKSEKAQEITQSVFISLLKGMKSFNYTSRFSTWLYTVTYREALALYGKEKKSLQREMPLHEEQTAGNVAFAATFDKQQEVALLLAPLSPFERFLLVSKEVDGLSFSEIASITQKSEGSLRTALSRLKKQLSQGGRNEN